MAQKRFTVKKASKGKNAPSRGLAAKVALAEKMINKVALPEFKAGDTVKVHVKIMEGEKERIQIYEGVVIARRNHGKGRSFIVRKISHGVGVERIFMETSPRIAKLDVVQSGRVRRAKLYYIRGLEGKSAKIDREVQTLAATAASEAAKTSKN